MLALSRLVAAWALASGLLELAVAFRLLGGDGERLLAVNGMLSLLFGILLLVQPPPGITPLVLWITACRMLSGILLLIRVGRVAPG